MDKNTKIAIGLATAATLYIQHWNIKELRRAHNALNHVVWSHLDAHRQAVIDAEFDRITKNFDRW